MNNKKVEPLVSIVIPTYNDVNNYLAQLLVSIDEQAYQNIEVIIVDDASTDNDHIERLKLLEKEKKSYSLQIVYQEKNTGPSGALNIGMSYAKGKYIKNCGHDDLFPKNTFASAVTYMEADKSVDVVFGAVQAFGSVNDVWPGIHGYGKKVKKDLSDLSFKKLFTNEVILIGPCCLMRKSILDKVGNFDTDVGVEDWAYFLRALDKGIGVHYIDEILYKQRKHDESLSRNALYVLLSRYKIVKKYQTRQDLKKEVAQHYVETLEQLMSISKKDFARTFKAIALDKDLGLMYMPKLFIKYPKLLPSLVFRIFVNPESSVFRKIKEKLKK